MLQIVYESEAMEITPYSVRYHGRNFLKSSPQGDSLNMRSIYSNMELKSSRLYGICPRFRQSPSVIRIPKGYKTSNNRWIWKFAWCAMHGRNGKNRNMKKFTRKLIHFNITTRWKVLPSWFLNAHWAFKYGNVRVFLRIVLPVVVKSD